MGEAGTPESASRGAIRVLIAEGSRLNCQLIQDGLRRRRQKLSVIAATVDTAHALTILKDQRPEIAIISERLFSGSRDGFTLARTIHQLKLPTRVIMLLDARERDAVIDAFGHGARGVVFRDEPLRTLIKCVHAVHQGQFWLNSANLGFIMDEFARLMPFAAHDAKGAKLLTKRQRDVVRLLNQGLSNRDIAAQSGLSEATVRNYLQHVFDKLGVSSRVELLTNYRHLGQVSLDEDPGAPSE